jgi:hypothetical protein
MELIPHCLETGGPHAAWEHITLLLDCADICRTAADYMLRGSSRHVGVCEVCAQVCDECASDCARISPDDEEMRRCGEICRKCNEVCRQTAQSAAGSPAA